jgi:hypothetical protein
MFFDPFQHSENVQCAFPTVKETVPRSRLGYATNNVFPEFPPLMSDGRSLIATYQSESDTNAILIKTNGIQSNWQYRNYLIDNGASIMNENFREACNDVGYFERFNRNDIGNGDKIKNTPHMYSSYTDDSKPHGYVNSDLKDLYLSREQLNSRKIAPTMTQDQLLKMGY